jgi:hypothetical protein
MKTIISLLIVLVISFVLMPETYAGKTEQWELIFNGGHGSGNCTLNKGQNGTIAADENCTYNYQGANVSGPYSNAPVTIAGASIAITASGTATNPSVPPAYQTSPFTSKISGRACNGHGSGTFEITFSNPVWPPSIKGTWPGTRKSGNGITAVAMPWITLLMFGDSEITDNCYISAI